jgi:hypothetical protein
MRCQYFFRLFRMWQQIFDRNSIFSSLLAAVAKNRSSHTKKKPTSYFAVYNSQINAIILLSKLHCAREVFSVTLLIEDVPISLRTSKLPMDNRVKSSVMHILRQFTLQEKKRKSLQIKNNVEMCCLNH